MASQQPGGCRRTCSVGNDSSECSHHASRISACGVVSVKFSVPRESATAIALMMVRISVEPAPGTVQRISFCFGKTRVNDQISVLPCLGKAMAGWTQSNGSATGQVGVPLATPIMMGSASQARHRLRTINAAPNVEVVALLTYGFAISLTKGGLLSTMKVLDLD